MNSKSIPPEARVLFYRTKRSAGKAGPPEPVPTARVVVRRPRRDGDGNGHDDPQGGPHRQGM